MAPRLDTDAVVYDLHDGLAAEPSIEQKLALEEDKERIFRAVIGIAEKYRRVLVSFYVRGESYEEITRNLSLPMSSVKWRIHEGRKRLRERWDNLMNDTEKVYDRIEWWIACNGSMDPYAYLNRQIARAITAAAYEKPLTVEEISCATGIPAVYIEDELDALLYGEALEQVGSKYATRFIILKLDDHRRMIERFHPLTADLAVCVLAGIRQREDRYSRDRLSWQRLPAGTPPVDPGPARAQSRRENGPARDSRSRTGGLSPADGRRVRLVRRARGGDR